MIGSSYCGSITTSLPIGSPPGFGSKYFSGAAIVRNHITLSKEDQQNIKEWKDLLKGKTTEDKT